MKTETAVLIVGGAVAFVLLSGITKGKFAAATGQATGEAVGNIVGSAPLGLVTGYLSTLKDAETYAKTQKSIPVIDWFAKPAGMVIGDIGMLSRSQDWGQTLKRIGSQNWNIFDPDVY